MNTIELTKQIMMLKYKKEFNIISREQFEENYLCLLHGITIIPVNMLRFPYKIGMN